VEIDFTKGEAKEALDKAVAAAVTEVEKGLKAKNAELLSEKKALEAKFEGIDADEYKALKAKARDAGDEGKNASEIRARVEAEFTPKLTKLEQELEVERTARRKDTIERSLTEALVQANISKDLMGAAKDHILARRKVDVGDGGATIDGKAASEFVQQWATTDGKAFVAAADNSGGGAKGSNGGGASGGKKAKDMTTTEKTAYIREHGLPAWQSKINESQVK
jgi:hypothetical protein